MVVRGDVGEGTEQQGSGSRGTFNFQITIRFISFFKIQDHNGITMSGKFEPKVPVTLDAPKDDPISLEELAMAKGEFAPLLSHHM